MPPAVKSLRQPLSNLFHCCCCQHGASSRNSNALRRPCCPAVTVTARSFSLIPSSDVSSEDFCIGEAEILTGLLAAACCLWSRITPAAADETCQVSFGNGKGERMGVSTVEAPLARSYPATVTCWSDVTIVASSITEPLRFGEIRTEERSPPRRCRGH